MDELTTGLPPRARRAVKNHRERILNIRKKFSEKVKNILDKANERRLQKIKQEIQSQ